MGADGVTSVFEPVQLLVGETGCSAAGFRRACFRGLGDPVDVDRRFVERSVPGGGRALADERSSTAPTTSPGLVRGELAGGTGYRPPIN